MEVYHYTKLDVLFKIVKQDGLHFKSTRYDRFVGVEEFEWSKSLITPIIKELVGDTYDGNMHFKLRPFIISFCKNGDSDYMWEKFADKNKGVVICLDDNMILKTSLKDQNPDLYLDCFYSTRGCEIRKWLIDTFHNEYLTPTENCIQDDYEALSTLIKQDYPSLVDENEKRYVILNHDCIHFSPDNIEGSEIENTQGQEKCCGSLTHVVHFPHCTLLKVIVGSEVSKKDYRKVLKYLHHCGYATDNKHCCQKESGS